MPLSGVEPEDKPTFVPEARDPVAYSRADNLFWNDQLMEHMIFFQMMMPGPELDGPRRQAAEFQRLLAIQVKESSAIDASNYVAFNRRSIDLAKRVSGYKKIMGEQQAEGKMRSLVWTQFFEHTAREADRLAARLALYNRREIDDDRADLIDFWSKTMGEHSGFIAHLLEPTERLLIDQASKLENAFLREGFKQVPGDDVMKAAHEVLDFKTIGEKGIKSGKIKSIIHPSLASHVRREAVRFVDELKRTA
ncbi:MAG: DUF2935 domain-containing protein [Betaproteobacteria bacterium]|nr:DUF2935 domain-containing protein [Betaproteobacteria bacterium]